MDNSKKRDGQRELTLLWVIPTEIIAGHTGIMFFRVGFVK